MNRGHSRDARRPQHGQNGRQQNNRGRRRRWRRQSEQSPSTSSRDPLLSSVSTGASSSSDSRGQSQRTKDIPGFYYDEEKGKYFKIVPGHSNVQSNAVTMERIEAKEAEKERVKNLQEFSSMIRLRPAQCSCSNCDSQSRTAPQKNILKLLEQRSLGIISNEQCRKSCLESSLQAIQLRGRHQIYGRTPPSRQRVEHMQQMWANSTGEYLACVWSLKNILCQLVQPIQVRKLSVVDEKRKLAVDVRHVGVAANYSSMRVSAVCWAMRGEETDIRNEYLLFTTNHNVGTLPSMIKLRQVLPGISRGDHNGHELNIGQRMTWTCAWTGGPAERLSVGTERCGLLLDMTRRLWELNTGGSDVLAQAFHQDGRLLHSGTRSGLILSHDIRGSPVPTPAFRLGRTKNPHTPSPPICHLMQLKHNANHLISADFSGKISLWDIRKREVVTTYTGNHNEHSKIPCHACEEEDLLYSAGSDNYIRVWRLSTGSLLRTIPPPHAASITTIPTVHFSTSLDRNFPALLVGVRDEMLVYSL